MKTRNKNELHPLGEGIFKIVKLVSSDTKWTLIFSPLSKGYQSIPRTYTIYKESDLFALEEIGCNISDPLKIKKKLKSFEGKTVLAFVGQARNEGFRNIEGFVVFNDDSLPSANP